jgi:hypothetical protein
MDIFVRSGNHTITALSDTEDINRTTIENFAFHKVEQKGMSKL